jgi:2-dehydro-3-deoxyphosphogluconate aldolase/(4S)-4-hydroxy-2-oxoglutarate aldolase
MHNNIKSILLKSPVMPVLVIDKIDNVEYLVEALIKGNINTIEITLRTSCALNVIEIISKKFPELMVGAGTVLNNKDLISIKNAGASFAVSPGSTYDLAKKAVEINFPFLPGVSSSSDIMKLLDLGYKCFKFFPAEAAGGIKYINSLRGPFPDIMFCPTGGISQTNAIEYLNLTNVICVGGSWIIPSEITDYKEITIRALSASKLVK